MFERLVVLEGIDSLEVNSDALTQLIIDVVESRGAAPSFEQLNSLAEKAESTSVADTLFVVGLMSAAISGDQRQMSLAARVLLNRETSTTYVDELNPKTPPSEFLEESYSWLVNNTVFTIPRQLVEAFPELIADKTPYWGATRDGYFYIERPEGFTGFSSDEHRQWFGLLADIESPSKDAWLGSMRFAKFKSMEINRGLLMYQPDYFINRAYGAKAEEYTPSPWLPCWGMIGPYEYFKRRDYLAARERALVALESELRNALGFPNDTARSSAKAFIASVELGFLWSSYGAEMCPNVVQLANSKRWNDAIDQYRDDQTALRVIGALIAQSQPNELPGFLLSLEANEMFEASDEIRSFALVAAGVQSTAILEREHEGWGEFNKNPLMYAAQFNQHDVIKWLIDYAPEMIETATVEAGYFGPKIYGRTPLMYAAEYSELPVVITLLGVSSELLIQSVDSDGRNVFHYLARNERLSDSERNEVIRVLQQRGFSPFSPSFDCWRASTKFELLACSKEEYASLDRSLNQIYRSAMANLSQRAANELKEEQQAWLATVGIDLIDNYSSSEFYKLTIEARIEAITNQLE